MKNNSWRKSLKTLFFFVSCIICTEVFATIFSVPSSDQSLYYLSIIFGSSLGPVNLGSGAANPTLSMMFEQFNYIILTVSAVVLSYLGVSSVINTAREGEALGKKISIWVPMRSFGGMLLMVPGPASGYSLIQATVMWIVLNGIGAADSVWNIVLTQLNNGVNPVSGVTVTLTPKDLKPVSQQVLRAATCMYSINTYMPELPNTTPAFQTYGSVKVYTAPVAGYPQQSPSTGTPIQMTQKTQINIGLQGASHSPIPYDTLCGSFMITSVLNSGDTLNTFNLATLNQRNQIQTQAVVAMFSAVDQIAQLLANPNITSSDIVGFDSGYVYNAGQAYINQIAQLATGIKSGPTSVSQDTQTLESYGWIQAGSYYYTMVQAGGAQLDPQVTPNGFTQPAITGVPISTALGTDGKPTAAGGGWPTNDTSSTQGVYSLSGTAPYYETKSLNLALANADSYYFYDQNSIPPAPSAGQALSMSSHGTGNGFMDVIVGGIASAIRDPILSHMEQVTSGNGGDPLVSLGSFGIDLMAAGEGAVFAALVSSIAISLAASSMSCMSPFAWGVNVLLVQLLPLIYGIAVLLWGAGATLGVYIPMIPYLIFVTSAFGWMIAVVEAVVGAPIIALGLTHPSDGELGKATEGLVIVANIFLRPTLMIFGFVLGASLMRAGLALINFGFIPALGNESTFFSIIAVLMMYMFLVMSLINKSFSLIYMLPNKILRWMGGRSEEFDPSDMIKESKQGHDSGSKIGNQALEQGFKKAGAKSEESTEKRNNQLPSETGPSNPGNAG